MTLALRRFLAVTDTAMLSYWLASLAACVGLFALPPGAMYDGYGTPLVDAWNWSFLPLDVAFALTGLWSVRLARRGDPRWRALAMVSLVLTMCAGGMAISYWALAGDFNWSWWIPNLGMLLAPLIWLPGLFTASGGVSAPPQAGMAS